MTDGLAVEKSLKQRFTACFAGVDTSHARATVLASIPNGPRNALPDHTRLPDKWNGINGLGTALASVAWPAGAAASPITCLAGSLGDPTKEEWIQELASAMTGRGAHALPSPKGEAPGLRLLYPTNATVFACVPVCVGGWGYARALTRLLTGLTDHSTHDTNQHTTGRTRR